MVLSSRHMIRPHELGALAAYGITDVNVLSVRVGLIPTGSELVEHHTRPAPGQIVESNTLMAAAVLTAAGAHCTRYSIVKDEPGLIRNAIENALKENEIVIVSAGSSAGTRDYTADVIAELGEVLVHGIAIKPGKPAIIGRVGGKPVIGMPGTLSQRSLSCGRLSSRCSGTMALPSQSRKPLRGSLRPRSTRTSAPRNLFSVPPAWWAGAGYFPRSRGGQACR